MLEKTLESPLNFKEIKPVNSEGNQSRIFIGRTDAEAPIIWPLDAKSQLIRKAPDVWESLKAEGKDMTEDEMVGWHHRLNGHGLGWTPAVYQWTGRLGMLWFMGSQRVGHD